MGMIPFKASYDAWGNQTISQESFYFRRGYTGHEMLPEYGLINMNGRLYDPQLGRFLSPDNYVQMPDFSQSFNRYSYCINNPLKFTDPDGEWFGLDDLIIAGVSFATSYIAKSISTGNWGWSSVKAGLFSAVSSYFGFNISGGASALGGVWNAASNIGVNNLANGLLPNATIPLGSHFGLSLSPAFAFSSESGLSFGAYSSLSYHSKDFDFSIGAGAGSNYSGWGASASSHGWGLGYGRTHYDETNVHGNTLGAQTVGSLTFGFGNDVSFMLSNDIFGEKHQDRWRTSAAELTIGGFTLGSYVTTNDGQHESKGKKSFFKCMHDSLLGENKNDMGTWEKGCAYSAPFWIGIRNGQLIQRFGYSHPYVQSLTQNLVHKYLVPTPFFKPSPSFYTGGFYNSGFNNPLTLW